MIKWLTIFLAGSLTASNDEIVKVDTQKIIMDAGPDLPISIAFEVRNGYHIQANKAGGDLIPTTLEIKCDKEITIKKQVFPPAKKFKLEGTDEYLDVYDGRFDIRLFFKTKAGFKKGTHRVEGKLNYQACDSIRCLFPRALEFSLNVEFR